MKLQNTDLPRPYLWKESLLGKEQDGGAGTGFGILAVIDKPKPCDPVDHSGGSFDFLCYWVGTPVAKRVIKMREKNEHIEHLEWMWCITGVQ